MRVLHLPRTRQGVGCIFNIQLRLRLCDFSIPAAGYFDRAEPLTEFVRRTVTLDSKRVLVLFHKHGIDIAFHWGLHHVALEVQDGLSEELLSKCIPRGGCQSTGFDQ